MGHLLVVVAAKDTPQPILQTADAIRGPAQTTMQFTLQRQQQKQLQQQSLQDATAKAAAATQALAAAKLALTQAASSNNMEDLNKLALAQVQAQQAFDKAQQAKQIIGIA